MWTGRSRSAASLGDPAQRVLADGVDRVGRERRGDPGTEALQLLEVAQGVLAQLRRVAVDVDQGGLPIVARRPASRTARAVAPGCQYMSQKRAVPVRIISTQASRAPQ